ncbi:MAG: hypothetical protein M1503_06520 [Thaumarchaeota archaeon]|nr:hypothetical protein [Nitrososphaerota archaeon]MCL5317897.1 hypothetical protein [Nitrososphaerota archaeon]
MRQLALLLRKRVTGILMFQRYASVDAAYRFVKFISLVLVVLTGLVMAGRESLQPLNETVGVLPTVVLFEAHIVAVLTLLSSIVFITIFNLFTHRPVISMGPRTSSALLIKWVIPALVLVTGITGLIIYEPFRWAIPFWLFNLGWSFIFAAKNAHLLLAYGVTLFLVIYLVVYLVLDRRVAHK